MTDRAHPRPIVAIDVGGTNARFALAQVAGGKVVQLGEPTTFDTGSVSGLDAAWLRFAASQDVPLPRAAAIAVAAPTRGEELRFTNSHWVIRPARLAEEMGLESHILINDFAAVAHAVASVGPEHFLHLAGPETALPATGVISICGPGTGLGVAQLWRDAHGYRVLPTEGGHVGFAPEDREEEAILAQVRDTLPRISVERMCSGPAIVALAQAIARIEGLPAPSGDDRDLWLSAFAGDDPVAVKACERFCMILGAAAGDMALAHGASGVVIAGGLGLRLKDRLRQSGFAERFTRKGRFAGIMRVIPVKLITHPQPGLFGAAAAFAQQFRRNPTLTR